MLDLSPASKTVLSLLVDFIDTLELAIVRCRVLPKLESADWKECLQTNVVIPEPRKKDMQL